MIDSEDLVGKKTIRNLTDLACFAKDFLAELHNSGANHGATIVTLRGDLGSGKTAFVRECAKVLGVEADITSPTFVIMKRYVLGAGREVGRDFTQLIHIDAYRLGSGGDLKTINWTQLITDPGNLIMIEWPERVEGPLSALGNDLVKNRVVNINIEHHDDGSRVFLITSIG